MGRLEIGCTNPCCDLVALMSVFVYISGIEQTEACAFQPIPRPPDGARQDAREQHALAVGDSRALSPGGSAPRESLRRAVAAESVFRQSVLLLFLGLFRRGQITTPDKILVLPELRLEKAFWLSEHLIEVKGGCERPRSPWGCIGGIRGRRSRPHLSWGKAG
jgi:hypothetical protein